MNKLKELESIRDKLGEILSFVNQRAQAERINLVQKSFAIKSIHLAFSYCHACTASPTGGCVYNNFVDPAHDDCIYCGEPEDRG